MFRVTIEATYLGQVVNNVIGVRGADAVPAGEQAIDLANLVAQYWPQTVMGEISAQYSFTGVNVVSATNPDVGAFKVGAGVGQNPNDPISGAICAAVEVRTALRGRAFRGRTGIAGMVETSVSGNTLVEAPRANLENAVILFRTRLMTPIAPRTESFEWGVISVYKGIGPEGAPLPRPGGPIFTPSTSVGVRARVGTRVSRLR
jgi:hypothetical protein